MPSKLFSVAALLLACGGAGNEVVQQEGCSKPVSTEEGSSMLQVKQQRRQKQEQQLSGGECEKDGEVMFQATACFGFRSCCYCDKDKGLKLYKKDEACRTWKLVDDFAYTNMGKDEFEFKGDNGPQVKYWGESKHWNSAEHACLTKEQAQWKIPMCNVEVAMSWWTFKSVYEEIMQKKAHCWCRDRNYGRDELVTRRTTDVAWEMLMKYKCSGEDSICKQPACQAGWTEAHVSPGDNGPAWWCRHEQSACVAAPGESGGNSIYSTCGAFSS